MQCHTGQQDSLRQVKLTCCSSCAGRSYVFTCFSSVVSLVEQVLLVWIQRSMSNCCPPSYAMPSPTERVSLVSQNQIMSVLTHTGPSRQTCPSLVHPLTLPHRKSKNATASKSLYGVCKHSRGLRKSKWRLIQVIYSVVTLACGTIHLKTWPSQTN